MTRWIRGLGALAVLLAGVAGAPIALVALDGDPWPKAGSWAALHDALFQPDDGTLLRHLLTMVAWVAWLVFAGSVLTELVAVLSRQRIRIRLPGLAGPQRFAAGLLVSVVAMLTLPQAAQSHAQVPAPTTSTGPVSPGADSQHPVAAPVRAPERPLPVTATRPHEQEPATRTHVVKVGDDLWSLAEHYYGRGQDWRIIARANPSVLTGGPDRLVPGWRLRIPEANPPTAADGSRTVIVREGDTLSSIAERNLGTAERWHQIFRANRAQLDDPDELAAGIRLRLPPADGAEDSSERHGGRQNGPGSHPNPPRPAGSHRLDAGQGSSHGTARPAAPHTSPSKSAEANPGGTRAANPASRSAQTPGTGGGTAEPVPSAAGDAPQVNPSQEASADLLAPLAGVGGLLAAGLVAGLAFRRRAQLQVRPVGRRIVHPPPRTRPVEVALGRRQRPLSLRTLDQAMRAIAAHFANTSPGALPSLLWAAVAEDHLELVLADACPTAPVGFTVTGRSWRLNAADADYLSSVPGLGDALRPWPALVTLGRDDRDRLVLADLEALGLLQLRAEDSGLAADVLAALAVELSFSPWADEMTLTLVGGSDRLPEVLGRHNVVRTNDIDGLFDRLERRAARQLEHQASDVPARHRLDPDLAEPWTPEIVLIDQPLADEQFQRCRSLTSANPRLTVATVIVDDREGAPWTLRLAGGATPTAVLQPADLALTPQTLDPPEVESVLDLVATTGSEETTAAPWWSTAAADEEDSGRSWPRAATPPDPPPDNVTYLGKRFGGWGSEDASGEEVRMQTPVTTQPRVHHPALQMLGPIELLGARGVPPTRAARQCLEYCAWLLEYPGTTARAMANGLVVAEGTRRSNMSRLRSWLGESPDGDPYLPDAYTGRIVLHPAVSSDWQRLQIFTAAGVDRTSTESLSAALELVRGAPLADAAPGQWHWAEELRTDMISCLRDLGVELTNRALAAGDLDLARWAAARALVAAPGDELLLGARIRTEHLAGNGPETERLTLQLAAQARSLGVDLEADTVTLLQEVMEGRVRARMA